MLPQLLKAPVNPPPPSKFNNLEFILRNRFDVCANTSRMFSTCMFFPYTFHVLMDVCFYFFSFCRLIQLPIHPYIPYTFCEINVYLFVLSLPV